nr:glycosyltransferase family 4 protein [Pseudanabaena sp. FACHB-1998]
MRNKNIPIIFRGDSHRIFTQNNWKSNLKKLFISKIFAGFDAFLYVGKANYNYFRYHAVPDKKLFFTPHSINYQFFTENSSEVLTKAKQWRQELGIPLTDAIILFAGKFEDKKRPLDLIKAFQLANLHAVSLLIVGAGVLEDEMRNLAKQDGDRLQNIFFAPFQNQSLMPRTYALADLFVLPSYGSGETWGLAINEAMCRGCPVIVSSHVGCAEDLVKPWQNGLIFEAGHVEALVNSLRDAFSDRDRLKQWGEESKKIIAPYSYENIIVGLKQALSAVL